MNEKTFKLTKIDVDTTFLNASVHLFGPKLAPFKGEKKNKLLPKI